MQEQAIDYELMDYIMMVGYRNIPEITAAIDALRIDQPEVFSLRMMLNSRFDPNAYEKLLATTSFFKMNRRDDLTKQTMVEEDTFYGHFCKQLL
jgi:hypothetical protein